MRNEQRQEVRKLQAEQRQKLRDKNLSRAERQKLRADQRRDLQDLRDKQKAARSEQAKPDATRPGQAAKSGEDAAKSRAEQREAQRKLRAEQRNQVRELQAEQRRALRDKDLSRAERQKLRAEQRKELRDLQEKQKEARQDAREDRQNARQNAVGERRNQAQRDRRRQQRADQLAERRKERAERRQQRLQQRQQARQERRIDRTQRISRQQARQGRFAALQNRQANRQARRLARIAARQAWRRGHHAHFVAWVGPVFWPYAYTDIFYYTFWPYAYDGGYWAYAYDDFFTSVFWAYPPDYYEDVYAGPYQSYARSTTGSAGPAPRAAPSRQVQRAVEQVCEPEKGLTAWPYEEIEKAVEPTEEQMRLLDDLRDAADDAAETFKSSCDPKFAMTPPGRLQGMISRINATLEAVQIVRPPLEAFYNSLNDEQRARFNRVGPSIGAQDARAARNRRQDTAQTSNCGEAKPGLTNLPMNRIEEVVRPTADQQAAMDKLSDATADAVDALQAACPDVIALTPVGRMEAMEKRLEAMLDAAETVQPALEEFYTSLSNEQKARFNTLGRDVARSN